MCPCDRVPIKVVYLPLAGCLDSVEWNGGMEWWNGIVKWWNGIFEA